MTTDKDYKRELERFFGYKIGFEDFSGCRKYETLCCINNNEYSPILAHDWFPIPVLKTSKSKYKDAFNQLIDESSLCTSTLGIKFKTDHPVPRSYEELCILNDLMGN